MRERIRESVLDIVFKKAGKSRFLELSEDGQSFDSRAAGKIGYFMGDEVQFTGTTVILYGGLFYEALFTEGRRKGEKVTVAANIASLYIG